METESIQILKDIGTPAVIVAAALITGMLKAIHKKLAIASGCITLFAILIYIPIEFWPQAKEAFSDTKLVVEPNLFFAENEIGKSIDLSVSCLNGTDTLKTISVPAREKSAWKDFPLQLKLTEEGNAIEVIRHKSLVGEITFENLKQIGFSRSSSHQNCNKKYYIASSKKVYLNRTWPLGETNTGLGILKLKFIRIDKGKIVVSVNSSKMQRPEPEVLKIDNKSFGIQTFESNFEVMVQVRAADFTIKGQEWAAFTVILFE